MTMRVMGSTSIRRREERFWLSYSPAQSILYPGGSLTCASTLRMASSTVVPRSRSRTLYLMAT